MEKSFPWHRRGYLKHLNQGVVSVLDAYFLNNNNKGQTKGGLRQAQLCPLIPQLLLHKSWAQGGERTQSAQAPQAVHHQVQT
jgi:hypothetical protein